MIDKLCEQSNLEAGFKVVKKNKGAPGVDGVTIKEFESRLKEDTDLAFRSDGNNSLRAVTMAPLVFGVQGLVN